MRQSIQIIRRATNPQKSIIAILSIAFAVLYLSEWKPLEIQGIGGGHDYADLTSVLNAATCYREIGANVYLGTNICDYQYGLFLLKLINLLNLNSLTPFFLGGSLFVLVTCLLLVIGTLSSISKKHVVMASLILLSPGPWLLFERGNFDLLIILFLAVTVVSINTKFSSIGAIFLLATALMKFYTFPLLLLYLLLEKEKWHRVGVGLASLVIIPLIIENIISAPGFPHPMFAAFGLPLPGLWVNFFAWRFSVDLVLGMFPQYIIGVVAFVSVILFFLQSKRVSNLRSMAAAIEFKSNLEKYIFLFSSLTYVGCFLAGSNFVYRLIFLAIALAILNKAMPGSMNSKVLITLELSALWLSYFYFGATGAIPVLLSIAGNAAQLVLAVFLFLYMYRFLLLEAKSLVISRFGFRRS